MAVLTLKDGSIKQVAGYSSFTLNDDTTRKIYNQAMSNGGIQDYVNAIVTGALHYDGVYTSYADMIAVIPVRNTIRVLNSTITDPVNADGNYIYDVDNLVWQYAGNSVDLSGMEQLQHKQDNLDVDGTGTKYPTVDAVNEGLAAAGKVNTVCGVEADTSKDVPLKSFDIPFTTEPTDSRTVGSELEFLDETKADNTDLENETTRATNAEQQVRGMVGNIFTFSGSSSYCKIVNKPSSVGGFKSIFEIDGWQYKVNVTWVLGNIQTSSIKVILLNEIDTTHQYTYGNQYEFRYSPTTQEIAIYKSLSNVSLSMRVIPYDDFSLSILDIQQQGGDGTCITPFPYLDIMPANTVNGDVAIKGKIITATYKRGDISSSGLLTRTNGTSIQINNYSAFTGEEAGQYSVASNVMSNLFGFPLTNSPAGVITLNKSDTYNTWTQIDYINQEGDRWYTEGNSSMGTPDATEWFRIRKGHSDDTSIGRIDSSGNVSYNDGRITTATTWAEFIELESGAYSITGDYGFNVLGCPRNYDATAILYHKEGGAVVDLLNIEGMRMSTRGINGTNRPNITDWVIWNVGYANARTVWTGHLYDDSLVSLPIDLLAGAVSVVFKGRQYITGQEDQTTSYKVQIDTDQIPDDGYASVAVPAYMESISGDTGKYSSGSVTLYKTGDTLSAGIKGKFHMDIDSTIELSDDSGLDVGICIDQIDYLYNVNMVDVYTKSELYNRIESDARFIGIESNFQTFSNTTLNLTTDDLLNYSANKIPRKLQEGLMQASNSQQTLTINISMGTTANPNISLQMLKCKGNLNINLPGTANTINNFTMQFFEVAGTLTVSVPQGFNGPSANINVSYGYGHNGITMNVGNNSGTQRCYVNSVNFANNHSNGSITQAIQAGAVIGSLVSGVVSAGTVNCSSNQAKGNVTQYVYGPGLTANTITIQNPAPVIYGAISQNNNIATGTVAQIFYASYANATGGSTEFHNGVNQNYNQGQAVNQTIMTEATGAATNMVKSFDKITSWSGNTITVNQDITAQERTWMLTPPGTANNTCYVTLPAGIGNRRVTAVGGTGNRTITFDGTAIATTTNVPAGNLTFYPNTGCTQLHLQAANAQLVARLTYLNGKAREWCVPVGGIAAGSRITAVSTTGASNGVFITLNNALTAATSSTVILCDTVPIKFYGAVNNAFSKNSGSTGVITGTTDLVVLQSLFNENGTSLYSTGFSETIVGKFIDGGNQTAGSGNTQKVVARSQNGIYLNLNAPTVCPANQAAGTATIRDVLGGGTIYQQYNAALAGVTQTIGSTAIIYPYAARDIISQYNRGYTVNQYVRRYNGMLLTKATNNPPTQIGGISFTGNVANISNGNECPYNSDIGAVGFYRNSCDYDSNMNLGAMNRILKTVIAESNSARRNLGFITNTNTLANTTQICGQMLVQYNLAPRIYLQYIRVESNTAYGYAVPTNGLINFTDNNGRIYFTNAYNWLISSGALIGVYFNGCSEVLMNQGVSMTIATSGNNYSYVIENCDSFRLTYQPTVPKLRIINVMNANIPGTYSITNIYGSNNAQVIDPASMIVANGRIISPS